MAEFEPPTLALRLLTNTAKQATRLGFKKVAAKAATKVNPALLVIEAAAELVSLAGSVLDYRTAKAKRNAVVAELAKVAKRLETQRKELAEKLETASRQLSHIGRIREPIVAVVAAAQDLFADCMTALVELRKSELPDLDELDRLEQRLEEAWRHLRENLVLLQTVSVADAVGTYCDGDRHDE